MNQNIFGAPAPSAFDTAINVTQFGWSEFDKVGITLIQDYIAQAQKLRDECVSSLEGIQGIIDGLPDIDRAYEYIQIAYADFSTKYPVFERDYEQFVTQFAQVQNMYAFIVDAKQEFDDGKVYIEGVIVQIHEYLKQARDALNKIQTLMTEMRVLHTEAKTYRDECAAFAEEVRLGKVYRGVWNPQVTGAYPAVPATNSYWDVMLNAGTNEYVFNGITWKAGNSLVYMKVDAKFEQAINPSAGVDSFNGRRGAIMPQVGDYTPDLVGADAAGTAVSTVNGAIADLKSDADPLPVYQLKAKLGESAVTSFNGKTGAVLGEEAWSVVDMSTASPDITALVGRVMFMVDTTVGPIEVNLNGNITELYVKDVGGNCQNNPLTINATAGVPINGETTETIDKNFGYVHYLKIGANLVTIGGM
ncbi:MAG: hypothetical protein ACRC6V_19315 [Bacteroidales bacterium]